LKVEFKYFTYSDPSKTTYSRGIICNILLTWW